MTAVFNTTDAKKGLQAVTTSFYGCGGDSSIVQSVHFKWDAALAATITFEVCNFPEADVAHDDPSTGANAGNWIQENPSTAVVSFSPSGAGSAVALTITVPGTTAGGCTVHLGNLGTYRMRVKVVATVAGQLRIRSHGKE